MLRRYSPEELTPGPEEAVDGMRETFIGAFRFTLGPGSAALATHAWAAWRCHLLAGDGVVVAEESAYAAASSELNSKLRYSVYMWVSEGRLRRAARRATAVATLCT